ncbi:hypothetical protein ACHAXN_002660 [Cyclotella atomus]
MKGRAAGWRQNTLITKSVSYFTTATGNDRCTSSESTKARKP